MLSYLIYVWWQSCSPPQAKSLHGGVRFSRSAHTMQLCCNFCSPIGLLNLNCGLGVCKTRAMPWGKSWDTRNILLNTKEPRFRNLYFSSLSSLPNTQNLKPGKYIFHLTWYILFPWFIFWIITIVIIKYFNVCSSNFYLIFLLHAALNQLLWMWPHRKGLKMNI